MKFMISSEAVEKVLQTVSSVFSGSHLERKKVANNLERAANAFLHENEEKFKSTKDLENYAADLRQRSCSYTDALETFLDDGMWESLFWCKGERVDLLESLKKVAGQKIKVIVGDLLMEVFVRNEVKNFDEVAKRSFGSVTGKPLRDSMHSQSLHPRCVPRLWKCFTFL